MHNVTSAYTTMSRSRSIKSVLFLTDLALSRAMFAQLIESDVNFTEIRFSFICEDVCVSLVACLVIYR